MTMHDIALTGHRPGRLGGYNLSTPYYRRMYTMLANLIADRLHTYDLVTVHTGMALGADTVWTMAALAVAADHPGRVRVVAHVPCTSQADRWTKTDRARYERLLACCDERVVYGTTYHPSLMHTRNRRMVDRADELVAIFDGQPSGGTYQCVAYARDKDVDVLVVDPDQFTD